MVYQRLLMYLVWVLLLSSPSRAQNFTADSAFRQMPLAKTIALYKDSMSDYNNLYNGIEYIGSYPGTTGSPYFEWDTLQQGSIHYNGVYYPSVPLKYDLVSNELVLKGKQNLLLSLVGDKVDFFTIRDHLFVHIRPDSSAQQPVAGFYEVLYNGTTPVLAKRFKKVERSSRVEDPFVFKPYVQYYIKKEDAYYPVEGEKDLLRLLGDKKELLKKFLRESNNNFKKAKEKSLVSTVAYYDQIKN